MPQCPVASACARWRYRPRARANGAPGQDSRSVDADLVFRHWASAALLAGGLLGNLRWPTSRPAASADFCPHHGPTAFDHAMIVTANLAG